MKNKKMMYPLLLLCCALLASCGDTAASPAAGETEPASAEIVTETEEVTEKTLYRSAELLGTYDFGGAEYHILGREYAKLGDLPAMEFTVEGENGDLINDTVFKRNRIVEEQYNVSVTSEQGAVSLAEKSVLAGDGAYDLIWAHINDMSSLATKGVLSDYYTLPVIDITQPWWNQLATQSLTVNGRCYLQMNYIPFTGVLLSHCLYFNKTIAAEYDLENCYDLVKNNGWTFDKFSALAKTVSRDVDGNGVFDDKDFYGVLASHGTSGAAFSIAMDVKAVKIHEDGTFDLILSSDRNQSILAKIVDLMSDPSAYLITDYAKENDLARMFAADQALFYSGFLTDSYQFFRAMESDFGLLPFPKYDESQPSYITTITGGTGLLGIPRVVADEEKTGVITEALAMESYNYVYPAIYDTVFEDKVLRDEDSMEMFDILMNGMEIDFGRTFKYGQYTDLFCDLVAKKSSDLMSAAAKQEKGAVKAYQKVIDTYYKD